jgi:drug/metabolite transporter (DMT)-like permease
MRDSATTTSSGPPAAILVGKLVARSIAYVACALIWGTTWFAIRRSIGAGGYPTLAAAAIRFAIAALVIGALWAVGWARPGPREARTVRALLAAGLLGALGYGLVYVAEQSISGGLAAVVYGTFPLVTALLATAGNVERVARSSLVGSVLALFGMAIVFADRLDVSRAQAIGVLLTLGSVFASSLYTTLLKRAASDVHPLATTGVFLATAGVVLAAVALVFERRPVPWPPPARPTVALLYLALVGSVLVFACYFFLLQRVSLMTISMLVIIEPIVALVVDAIWEKEVVLVARSYAGICVTVAGVGLSLLVGERQKA